LQFIELSKPINFAIKTSFLSQQCPFSFFKEMDSFSTDVVFRHAEDLQSKRKSDIIFSGEP